MKKVILLFAVAVASYSVNAQAVQKLKPESAVDNKAATGPAQIQEVKQPADVAKMVNIKNEDFDFGKIPYGKPAEYILSIKNISKEPVTLQEVKVGCGCTTPKYERNTVIQPGKSYDVTLGFNGYTDGHFEKIATLVFNDGASKIVKFHGDTFKTPENAAPANEGVKSLKAAN
jgi:hypothetical protein